MKPSPPTSSAAHPVRALRERVIELEAAFIVCLTESKPEQVHHLRTTVRRLEATLDLLAELPDLPPFRGRARKLLRVLKKVRRAAGVVRDLDVQRKLMETHEVTESSAGSRKAAEFAELLVKQRKRAARKLQEELAARRGKVVRRLEALVRALEPAESVSIPATEVLKLSEGRFRGTHALIMRNPSVEHLHSIRKAAKVARYQAELVDGSTTARRAAKVYRSLQQAGGQWHDWRDLAESASAELGEKHPAAAHFGEIRDRHNVSYRELLAEFRKSHQG